jgi:hypothetical protein
LAVTGCGAEPTAVLPFGLDVGTGAGQQSHLQGGQDAPSVHAGQAQPQPPLPVEPPPSAGGLIRTHWPVGQGVVKHAI